MSMYVDLLCTALDDWAHEMSRGALISYVCSCRDVMLNPGIYEGGSSCGLLAVEIAYDRALIRLCELYRINVEPSDFMYPLQARARLELQLTLAGVDLSASENQEPSELSP
jgi:hypothetical protein